MNNDERILLRYICDGDMRMAQMQARCILTAISSQRDAAFRDDMLRRMDARKDFVKLPDSVKGLLAVEDSTVFPTGLPGWPTAASRKAVIPMCEILFRGKRLDNGEWIEGFYWKDIWGDGESCYIFYDGEDYQVDPATVGQYTGLTDKNGVKIFEGDIVDIQCENEEVGVIEWDKNTAKFIVSADGFYADFDNYYGYDLEVIDSIYDNPELMEG